jgi:hypothetical protein
MYATRSRFIPDALLSFFERRRRGDDRGMATQRRSGARHDIAGRLRARWR